MATETHALVKHGRHRPPIGLVGNNPVVIAVSNKMFPLGCLIKRKRPEIKIFSSPVAALDNADLAMSSGCDNT